MFETIFYEILGLSVAFLLKHKTALSFENQKIVPKSLKFLK